MGSISNEGETELRLECFSFYRIKNFRDKVCLPQMLARSVENFKNSSGKSAAIQVTTNALKNMALQTEQRGLISQG
jgi:hypothetical protein